MTLHVDQIAGKDNMISSPSWWAFECKHVLSCIHFFFHFMTSPTFVHRLFMASPLIPTGPYCSLSFWFFHFLSVTVSPMENKREASVAGLGWPSTSNRGNPVTRPDASTIEAPAPTTSTPSASWEALTTPNDPGNSTPIDTYSAPPQPAVPFPTQDGSTYMALHHARFSSRVVHQIHFKIFTHSNNTRELFIEEIPTSGISKCRDPEHYFYGLSGNWGVVFTHCGLLAPSFWNSSSTRAQSFSQCSHWDDLSCRWTWPSHPDPGFSKTSIRYFEGCYGIWGTQRDLGDGWTHELPRCHPNPSTSSEFLFWMKWSPPVCTLAFYRLTSTCALLHPRAKLFQKSNPATAGCVCVCVSHL